QVSLVLPGMSGLFGVQPATVISPPAWPAGWLAPGSDAVPPPPHAVATRAIDVTPASATPPVLPRIRFPPPVCALARARQPDAGKRLDFPREGNSPRPPNNYPTAFSLIIGHSPN